MSAFESETASKKPIDEHVQNTLMFIQKHESILHNIEKATRTTIMPSSDSHSRPIKLTTESVERVLPQDLIFTDNEPVRKSVTVLVFLCDEISQLREIAETRFFRPLLMFGQNPPDAVDFEKSKHPPKPEEPLFEQAGMKEKMVGRFMPFLQELSNFIDRCYSVCLNLVQQLASLMDNKELLYRCMFNSMHLTSVFKSLGELLTILISLDAIVAHNDNLQDAWASYKSMISLARMDAAAFGTTTEDIAKFERLLVSVDQAIMIGAFLLCFICIAQFVWNIVSYIPLCLSVYDIVIFLFVYFNRRDFQGLHRTELRDGPRRRRRVHDPHQCAQQCQLHDWRDALLSETDHRAERAGDGHGQ